jgi:GTPase SAR1 family protein
MSKNKDPTLVHRKVAILGFRAVGKSSLTNSFMTGTFSDNYDPTIESTHHKTIRFRKVHFATDIVDTAGMVSRKTQQSLHATIYPSIHRGSTNFNTYYRMTGRILSSVQKCFLGCPWLRARLFHYLETIL